MKKTTISLRSIIALIAIIVSCKEASIVKDEVDISHLKPAEMTYEQQLLYTTNHLTTIGQAILSISHEEEFRNTLYSEMDKKFDGQNNVLIQKLIESPYHNNKSTIGQRLITGLKDLSIESDVMVASNAFKDIEGTDYYPQIYIPFYEELKAAKNIGSGRSESAGPTVIIYNGDESKLEYDGLTLGADGNLVQSGLKVNEAYAMENEVWILGISETLIGCDGEMSRCAEVGDTGGTSGGNGTNGTYSDNFVIPKIKVKHHKESWASGASEVHILVWMDNINLSASNARLIKLTEEYYGPFEGNRINKVRRRDVRRETSLTVNFDFVKQWEATYINKNYAYYVLFEYDPWPAGKRSAWWLSNLEIKYRSQDSWYAKDVVFRGAAEYYSVNNGSIEFSID